jgi:hypothetical protein
LETTGPKGVTEGLVIWVARVLRFWVVSAGVLNSQLRNTGRDADGETRCTKDRIGSAAWHLCVAKVWVDLFPDRFGFVVSDRLRNTQNGDGEKQYGKAQILDGSASGTGTSCPLFGSWAGSCANGKITRANRPVPFSSERNANEAND